MNNPIKKMGQKPEQTSHERKYTDGKQAYKIYSISYVINKVQMKTSGRYHYTPIRMTEIQNTDITKCCHGCEATGNQIY